MKEGDYIKFNDFCGLACVKNEVTNDTWVVVYADVFTKLFNDPVLGQVVGKGKTTEEALIDAIKFFVRREEIYENALNENDEEDCNNVKSILHEAFNFLSSRMLSNQKEIVLPTKAWTFDYQKGYTETGKIWNADIFIDKEGKAVEGNS